MRATAAPSAGNIAQAEKIIAAMKAAGSLERRFARLEDIRPLWTPAGAHAGKRDKAGAKGVFAEVKAKGRPSAQIEGPTVTMTWEKFLRTVLPTAEQIEYQVPTSKQMYLGMVTAKHPDAPPILQWDLPDERNPVSLYVYVQGSPPAQWNLRPDSWHPVSAVTLQPAAWSTRHKFSHHGERVIFVLAGAKDLTVAPSVKSEPGLALWAMPELPESWQGTLDTLRPPRAKTAVSLTRNCMSDTTAWKRPRTRCASSNVSSAGVISIRGNMLAIINEIVREGLSWWLLSASCSAGPWSPHAAPRTLTGAQGFAIVRRCASPWEPRTSARSGGRAMTTSTSPC